MSNSKLTPEARADINARARRELKRLQKPQYIGDSVYCYVDDCGATVLFLNNGERDRNGNPLEKNRIVLDPGVADNLVRMSRKFSEVVATLRDEQDHSFNTETEIRNSFWYIYAGLNGVEVRDPEKDHNDYNCTTRTAFVNFLDELHKSGKISDALAKRATL